MPLAADHAELSKSLRDAGLIRSSVPELRALTGGISSDLLLVQEGNVQFVVKRALPKLRVSDDWPADVSRNRVERHYLAYAREIIPDSVPRLLGGSPADGWFAMEYLGREFTPWKTLLLRGETELAVGRRAGWILGRLHCASWNDSVARERFATWENFRQLRIEPYLLTTARRLPAAGAELEAEAERLARTQIALVHGDYSPKNLLVGAGRVVVLDAECGWFGDPAFDPAFLLNHLHLKALLRPRDPAPLLALAQAFWSAYAETLGPRSDSEFEARTVRLLLCLMLARVHGKSPVEYLVNSAQRDFVTNFAVAGLRAPPRNLADVTEAWKAGLTSGHRLPAP